MDETTRNLVRDRAGNRCEYCQLRQDQQPAFRFHVEHIRPVKHGGSDGLTNLALACRHCNLHKSSNLSGIDNDTIVPLFNPRSDTWDQHFVLQGDIIIGLTPTGRATVTVLQMNHSKRVQLRRSHRISGVFE